MAKNIDREKEKKESLRYLPAIISLSAGLIISIVMLVNRKEPLTSLISVFAFLLGFYIIGSIFRAILIAMATKEEPEEEEKDLENVDMVQNEEEQ